MFEEMKELIGKLNAASKAYYQEDREILTDREYDALYDKLCKLEEESGSILANSPTQKVGYAIVSSLEKVNHESKILSLDKTKEVAKLQSWLGEKRGILSWKLDGLTIVLKYQDGALVQAITRGTGEVGEDVTHNAKVFSNIPLQIAYKGELVLRGEGVIPYSVFRRINEELPEDEAYKNPRNLCSGTVRQLNSQVAAKRDVHFFAFTLVTGGEGQWQDTKSSQLAWLSSLGFSLVEHELVTADTVAKAVARFSEKVEDNDFATDGLVLTFDEIAYSQSLGNTAKFPRDSIAFKWADEMAETVLREIEWNTSRTGLMNPVAVFDPVDLEGSQVSRASVHNVSILEELRLGIGDRIRVYKANMIIPQVAENLTGSGGVEIPKTCFVCGGETEVRQQREGKALYCTNPQCQAQKIRALSHFVSRDAMNVEGLSEETLRKFIGEGYIKEYPDLFALNDFAEEIKAQEGFGEKSFENLMASLEKARETSLYRFIYALGINHVGLQNAKLLCKTFEDDLEKIKQATEEELMAIDGFGEVIAHSIVTYFQDKEHLQLLDRGFSYLQLLVSEYPKEENQPLTGKSFVVTGDLELFSNRKELVEKVESLGGKVTGSVTKKTAALVNNDVHSTSSKNKKAQDLGIPILSEKEFVEKFL